MFDGRKGLQRRGRKTSPGSWRVTRALWNPRNPKVPAVPCQIPNPCVLHRNAELKDFQGTKKTGMLLCCVSLTHYSSLIQVFKLINNINYIGAGYFFQFVGESKTRGHQNYKLLPTPQPKAAERDKH